jgi:hypothetical protein
VGRSANAEVDVRILLCLESARLPFINVSGADRGHRHLRRVVAVVGGHQAIGRDVPLARGDGTDLLFRADQDRRDQIPLGRVDRSLSARRRCTGERATARLDHA